MLLRLCGAARSGQQMLQAGSWQHGAALHTLTRTSTRQMSRQTSHFPLLSEDNTFTPEQMSDNARANMELYAKVDQIRATVYSGDEKISSQPKEGRKLTVKERVALLKDTGTEVLEIGTLAGLNMPYGNVLNASITVAIAQVYGELCMIAANDWTFKGGTSYPITLKKNLRGQEIAMQNRLPCIYLVDSGGAFLPLQADIFPDKEHGGRMFRNEAVLSSMGIPQLAVVCGSCTAGGAYVPTMCDEAVMVRHIGSLYLAGPPLVKAAIGEEITSEALGGADVHCSISGCTDYYASSEEEGLATLRNCVQSLNVKHRTDVRVFQPEAPCCEGTAEEFATLIPVGGAKEDEGVWPIRSIMARIVDGGKMQLFKEKFGTTLLTGFARIAGVLVGVVANDGELTARAATKGAHFIRLCSTRGVPLVFLQNTPSDALFLSATGSDGLTAKARGQMIAAVACSRVPKLTVVLGGSYGPSSYAMCGRSMQPNFLFAWPQARMSVASPQDILDCLREQQQAEQQHRSRDSEEAALLERLAREEWEHPSSNLVNDGVILPHQTREVLSRCLEICLKYEAPSEYRNSAGLNVIRM